MRTLLRPCLGCGTSVRGKPRCADCDRTHQRAKRQRRPDLDDAAERRRRRQLVADHRATIGDWCPGVPELRRGAHPSADLTADHVVEVAAGGDPRGLLVVRCRSCNAARSAWLATGLCVAVGLTTPRPPKFPREATLFETTSDGPTVA